MDEYVCLTVLSRPGEAQADFSTRLSRFWTAMLRTRPDDFEKVYAESSAFEKSAACWSRRYLAEEAVMAVLETELIAAKVDFEPIDRDDLYSRYEAAPPEWMQIEH